MRCHGLVEQVVELLEDIGMATELGVEMIHSVLIKTKETLNSAFLKMYGLVG